ncbi:transglycosylase [Dimargaris xerosporica]|nr:transglycosylase [Dimargaris xerosporica]
MRLLLSTTALLALCLAVIPTWAQSGGQECSSREWNFNSAQEMGDFRVDWCPENAYVENGRLVLRLTQSCGTTVIYPKQMRSGRIDASIQAGPTSGVVTAFILQGASKDEIDFEWVGKDPARVQSMYFVGGNRVPGDELPGYHSLGQDASSGYNLYSIEFNPDRVEWFVNNRSVRTLARRSGRAFPTSADLLRMGVWDGSQNHYWAGVVDWSQASYYEAYVSSLRITEYC